MKLLHSVASIENFVHPWHYTSSSGGFSNGVIIKRSPIIFLNHRAHVFTNFGNKIYATKDDEVDKSERLELTKAISVNHVMTKFDVDVFFPKLFKYDIGKIKASNVFN